MRQKPSVFSKYGKQRAHPVCQSPEETVVYDDQTFNAGSISLYY